MKEPESYWTQSKSEFMQAVIKTFSLARHQIWLYDLNYDDWPLDSLECANTLADALLRMKQSAVEIVPCTLLLRDPDWLEKHGARLSQLRRRFPALIDIRQTPENYASAEAVVIVDQQHAVIRPHKDSFRAKTVIALPSEVENRQAKLRQVRDISLPCLPSTTLGL
jgi:hypothetical protein